jgi:lipoate---protein ligase
MRYFDLSATDVGPALGLEETLLKQLVPGADFREQDSEICLLWRPESFCAVLGTARPASGDLFLDNLKADSVPVIRRRSGGGTVVLGPGIPVITLLLSTDLGITAAYRRFSILLSAIFSRMGLEVHFERPADMAAGSKKIAGLAQRRLKGALLLTASILAENIKPQVIRYIREPSVKDSPQYRSGRGHTEFMTTLSELGFEQPEPSFVQAFRDEMLEQGANECRASSREIKEAAKISQQLSAPEWVWRFP